MADDTQDWAYWYAKRSPVKAAKYVSRYVDSSDDFMRARAVVLRSKLVEQERCADCGRPLKDPTSVARGIGPDCWEARQAKGTPA